jgi:DNA invertase Pin-like site-specific DNA recombinase
MKRASAKPLRPRKLIVLDPFDIAKGKHALHPITRSPRARHPKAKPTHADATGLTEALVRGRRTGALYGYARVSTDAQDLTGQLAQLKAAGCERVFREKISGATADRPQLKKLMAAVGPGDVVIIPAVDRLSRDTTDLLVIARDLQKAGAGLRSIAEPVVDTTSDFAELVLAMLGVAAKLERRRIRERTARGRADAKAKGVKFGRKPKLTEHQKREAIKRRDVDEETLRSIGRSYNVSAATISRLPP